MSALNGVLPVDKPEGPTSHDVVARARRDLRLRRIGHTGTLDPFASGLLLLCLGPATRVAEYLTALEKAYSATIRLGATTDTDDLQGEIVRSAEGWSHLGRDEVDAALQRQVGTIMQLPPAYSAKKVAGERMYAAARRGEVLERDPVQVTIHSITITRFELPEVDVEVECGSGTYIRAIARDLGEALGVGGHLTRLRRMRVGHCSVDRALSLDLLTERESVQSALLTPAEALVHLPSLTLSAAELADVRHGRAVAVGAGEVISAESPIVLLSPDGQLVAMGELDGGTIRPRKVFA